MAMFFEEVDDLVLVSEAGRGRRTRWQGRIRPSPRRPRGCGSPHQGQAKAHFDHDGQQIGQVRQRQAGGHDVGLGRGRGGELAEAADQEKAGQQDAADRDEAEKRRSCS